MLGKEWGEDQQDNEAIIVKGPCSESVIYKHEERYQEFEWFCKNAISLPSKEKVLQEGSNY